MRLVSASSPRRPCHVLRQSCHWLYRYHRAVCSVTVVRAISSVVAKGTENELFHRWTSQQQKGKRCAIYIHNRFHYVTLLKRAASQICKTPKFCHNNNANNSYNTQKDQCIKAVTGARCTPTIQRRLLSACMETSRLKP